MFFPISLVFISKCWFKGQTTSRIHLSLPNVYKLMWSDRNINRKRDDKFFEWDCWSLHWRKKITLRKKKFGQRIFLAKKIVFGFERLKKIFQILRNIQHSKLSLPKIDWWDVKDNYLWLSTKYLLSHIFLVQSSISIKGVKIIRSDAASGWAGWAPGIWGFS